MLTPGAPEAEEKIAKKPGLQQTGMTYLSRNSGSSGRKNVSFPATCARFLLNDSRRFGALSFVIYGVNVSGMSTTDKHHRNSREAGTSAFSFIRSAALYLVILAVVCSAFIAFNSSDVQSRQTQMSLSDHAALVDIKQAIIDRQNQTISRLEDILSYAIGEKYDGQGVKTMTVTATAYTARKEECNAQPWITASGTPSRVGVIAVSRDMEELGIGMGDVVIIKGMGLFRVEDRMNKRWEKRVDILHANLQAAKLFAKKKVEIMWFDDAATAPVG